MADNLKKQKFISNNCAFLRRQKHQQTSSSSFIYVINTNERTNTRAPTACEINIQHTLTHYVTFMRIERFIKFFEYKTKMATELSLDFKNLHSHITIGWFLLNIVYAANDGRICVERKKLNETQTHHIQ